MHFIHLLAINFYSDALIRFQKVVMDNANSRLSPQSSVLAISVLERVWVLKPLSQSFRIVIKDPFFFLSKVIIQSRNESFKFHKNNIKQFEFHKVYVKAIYQVSSGDDPILLKFWHSLPRHFSDTLAWLLFNKCFQMFVIWNQCHSVKSQVNPLHYILRWNL